jgi:hypothetical protein
MVRILSELKTNPVEVRGRGRSDLAQLVTMVYMLDWASYYVAIGMGRDPFPTRLMDRMKRSGYWRHPNRAPMHQRRSNQTGFVLP